MPIKSVKMKISKNKKMRFFLMSQGSLNPKIRFLGQKVWPVACAQTDRQTDWKRKNRANLELSEFLASAYDQEAVQKQRKAFQGYRSFILWSRSGPKLHFCVYFCLVGFHCCKAYDFIMIADDNNNNNSYCLHNKQKSAPKLKARRVKVYWFL